MPVLFTSQDTSPHYKQQIVPLVFLSHHRTPPPPACCLGPGTGTSPWTLRPRKRLSRRRVRTWTRSRSSPGSSWSHFLRTGHIYQAWRLFSAPNHSLFPAIYVILVTALLTDSKIVFYPSHQVKFLVLFQFVNFVMFSFPCKKFSPRSVPPGRA